MYSIEVDHIWKKFKKGESFTTLRDHIDYFLKRSLDANYVLAKKEFWAVENISFKARKGEILGIIGANGAGKSTLFNILAGIVMPTQGSFKIHGKLAALIELTAGFHPDFTGRKNVYFNGAILGMTRKEIDRKFDDIVKFSEIGDFIDTPVKRYSSGMYARLGFAIAAHVNPEVLLVDEVLSVGDIKFQHKCMKKMKDLAKKGTTIIFVSHNLAAVQSFCKRVILLERGRMVEDSDPEEVIALYQQKVLDSEIKDLQESFEDEDEQESKEYCSGQFNFVELYSSHNKKTDVFEFNESITVRFNVQVYQPVERPIFFVEIVRLDGVVCCEAVGKAQEFSLDVFDQQGTFNVCFSNTHLMPGVYFTRVSLWDEKFLTPLIMASRSVFKVESEEIDHSESVFHSQTAWEKEP
ncbi:MAG: ABC transporter ATP-binding protein [Candidatus Omnitrophica bacterium]|nr:ABC transporter ATP-binding protein [Candidatus Omnitrophota bacterium]